MATMWRDVILARVRGAAVLEGTSTVMFSASELVTMLVGSGVVVSRSTGVELGEALRARDVICPSTGEFRFQDTNMQWICRHGDAISPETSFSVAALMNSSNYVLCAPFLKQGAVFLNPRFFLLDRTTCRLYVYSHDYSTAPRYYVDFGNVSCYVSLIYPGMTTNAFGTRVSTQNDASILNTEYDSDTEGEDSQVFPPPLAPWLPRGSAIGALPAGRNKAWGFSLIGTSLRILAYTSSERRARVWVRILQEVCHCKPPKPVLSHSQQRLREINIAPPLALIPSKAVLQSLQSSSILSDARNENRLKSPYNRNGVESGAATVGTNGLSNKMSGLLMPSKSSGAHGRGFQGSGSIQSPNRASNNAQGGYDSDSSSSHSDSPLPLELVQMHQALDPLEFSNRRPSRVAGSLLPVGSDGRPDLSSSELIMGDIVNGGAPSVHGLTPRQLLLVPHVELRRALPPTWAAQFGAHARENQLAPVPLDDHMCLCGALTPWDYVSESELAQLSPAEMENVYGDALEALLHALRPILLESDTHTHHLPPASGGGVDMRPLRALLLQPWRVAAQLAVFVPSHQRYILERVAAFVPELPLEQALESDSESESESESDTEVVVSQVGTQTSSGPSESSRESRNGHAEPRQSSAGSNSLFGEDSPVNVRPRPAFLNISEPFSVSISPYKDTPLGDIDYPVQTVSTSAILSTSKGPIFHATPAESSSSRQSTSSPVLTEAHSDTSLSSSAAVHGTTRASPPAPPPTLTRAQSAFNDFKQETPVRAEVPQAAAASSTSSSTESTILSPARRRLESMRRAADSLSSASQSIPFTTSAGTANVSVAPPSVSTPPIPPFTREPSSQTPSTAPKPQIKTKEEVVRAGDVAAGGFAAQRALLQLRIASVFSAYAAQVDVVSTSQEAALAVGLGSPGLGFSTSSVALSLPLGKAAAPGVRSPGAGLASPSSLVSVPQGDPAAGLRSIHIDHDEARVSIRFANHDETPTKDAVSASRVGSTPSQVGALSSGMVSHALDAFLTLDSSLCESWAVDIARLGATSRAAFRAFPTSTSASSVAISASTEAEKPRSPSVVFTGARERGRSLRSPSFDLGVAFAAHQQNLQNQLNSALRRRASSADAYHYGQLLGQWDDILEGLAPSVSPRRRTDTMSSTSNSTSNSSFSLDSPTKKLKFEVPGADSNKIDGPISVAGTGSAVIYENSSVLERENARNHSSAAFLNARRAQNEMENAIAAIGSKSGISTSNPPSGGSGGEDSTLIIAKVIELSTTRLRTLMTQQMVAVLMRGHHPISKLLQHVCASIVATYGVAVHAQLSHSDLPSRQRHEIIANLRADVQPVILRAARAVREWPRAWLSRLHDWGATAVCLRPSAVFQNAPADALLCQLGHLEAVAPDSAGWDDLAAEAWKFVCKLAQSIAVSEKELDDLCRDAVQSVVFRALGPCISDAYRLVYEEEDTNLRSAYQLLWGITASQIDVDKGLRLDAVRRTPPVPLKHLVRVAPSSYVSEQSKISNNNDNNDLIEPHTSKSILDSNEVDSLTENESLEPSLSPEEVYLKQSVRLSTLPSQLEFLLDGFARARAQGISPLLLWPSACVPPQVASVLLISTATQLRFHVPTLPPKLLAARLGDGEAEGLVRTLNARLAPAVASFAAAARSAGVRLFSDLSLLSHLRSLDDSSGLRLPSDLLLASDFSSFGSTELSKKSIQEGSPLGYFAARNTLFPDYASGTEQLPAALSALQPAVSVLQLMPLFPEPNMKLKVLSCTVETLCRLISSQRAAMQAGASLAIQPPTAAALSTTLTAPTALESAHINADDLLGLLCLVLIHARVPCLSSEVSFISDFVSEELMIEKPGFFLTSLHAAVAYACSNEIRQRIKCGHCETGSPEDVKWKCTCCGRLLCDSCDELLHPSPAFLRNAKLKARTITNSLQRSVQQAQTALAAGTRTLSKAQRLSIESSILKNNTHLEIVRLELDEMERMSNHNRVPAPISLIQSQKVISDRYEKLISKAKKLLPVSPVGVSSYSAEFSRTIDNSRGVINRSIRSGSIPEQISTRSSKQLYSKYTQANGFQTAAPLTRSFSRLSFDLGSSPVDIHSEKYKNLIDVFNNANTP